MVEALCLQISRDNLKTKLCNFYNLSSFFCQRSSSFLSQKRKKTIKGPGGKRFLFIVFLFRTEIKMNIVSGIRVNKS